MRSLGISLVSISLTLAVIGNAYYQKKQFYPSVVYITKSNPSMVVIYVQSLVLVLMLGKLIRKVNENLAKQSGTILCLLHNSRTHRSFWDNWGRRRLNVSWNAFGTHWQKPVSPLPCSAMTLIQSLSRYLPFYCFSNHSIGWLKNELIMWVFYKRVYFGIEN